MGTKEEEDDDDEENFPTLSFSRSQDFFSDTRERERSRQAEWREPDQFSRDLKNASKSL